MGGRGLLEKKTLKELKKIAKKMNIEVEKVITHSKKSGWYDKGKRLVQTLYGHGQIDMESLADNKIRTEDEDGNLVKDLSLLHMMERCTDFLNEVSQLEHIGESLGVRVVITTKYHAEYAGEGIEYSWGYAKCLDRGHPLSAKKGGEISMH
jgi:hypothetical protein